MVPRLIRSCVALAVTLLLAMALTAPVAAKPEAERITRADLYNAKVPSLCGHPAGRLVDGHLPGIEEGRGDVWFTGKAAFGRIQPRKAPGAVAVIGCHHGGVGWPDNLVMYDAEGNVVGARSLGRITGSGREGVRRVRVVNGRIRVEVIGIKIDGDDCEACARGSALVWLRWAPKRQQFLVVSKRMYRERSAAVQTVRAVREGRRKAALRHSSRAVVNELFAIRRQKGRLSMGRCVGRLNPGWPGWADPEFRFLRMCVVLVKWPGGYESGYGLFMSPATWRTWKGRKLVGIAG